MLKIYRYNPGPRIYKGGRRPPAESYKPRAACASAPPAPTPAAGTMAAVAQTQLWACFKLAIGKTARNRGTLLSILVDGQR